MEKSERWKKLPNWPYEVSSLGHIRRVNSNKLINPYWDKQGFGIVTLKKGQRSEEFWLDSTIASTFTDRPLNGQRPLHVDGLPWNNWPKNLLWGLSMQLDSGENLVANWTAWKQGHLQHGPYTDRELVVSVAQPGDVVLGRNLKRQIVSFEIMFNRNRAMSPRNPFDLADEYRAAAKMHNDAFWSIMMSEAAEVIDSLGMQVLDRITNGRPQELSLPAKLPAGMIPRRPLSNGHDTLPTAAIEPIPSTGIPRRPLSLVRRPLR
jgi:hypothetical protein